jgi:hypothetical protein
MQSSLTIDASNRMLIALPVGSAMIQPNQYQWLSQSQVSSFAGPYGIMVNPRTGHTAHVQRNYHVVTPQQ